VRSTLDQTPAARLLKPRVYSLPNFKQSPSLIGRLVKRSLLFTICVLLGLFYGFSFAILPPSLMTALGIPILILMLVIIWALPDVGYAPTTLLIRLFLIYVIVVPLWPNYLSLQIPGLPWISIRRLVVFPLFITFLICLSISAEFRGDLSKVLYHHKAIFRLLVLFSFIQVATVALSDSPSFSLNATINYIIANNAVFAVAAWALSKDKRADRYINLLLFSALFLCVFSVFEYRNLKPLWANHVPSFLALDGEMVSQYLTPVLRNGIYRVTSTFSVSLSFAEYLAIVSPFAFHKMISTHHIGRMLLWLAYDFFLLFVIVLTQSRLGILGWIVAHVAYILLWSAKRWATRKTAILAPAIALTFPVGALFLFVGMFTIPAIRNRTIGGGATGLSDDARRQQFDLLWPRLLENPFGFGTGRSGAELGYVTPGGFVTVDSYVITMLMDYGVLGFFAFAGIIIFAALRSLKVTWRSTGAAGDLAMPLTAAFGAVIQARLVLSQGDNLPLIFMLVGMSVALSYRCSLEDRAIRP
jgi:hypothetical protein